MPRYKYEIGQTVILVNGETGIIKNRHYDYWNRNGEKFYDKICQYFINDIWWTKGEIVGVKDETK